jgi:carbonic anhydrase
MNNIKFNRNLLQQVNETSESQYPFAIILSCIDSRTSAELVFDQGLGDIFSARVAGNVVNEDIIGSMEFACKVAGSKLIVVLGHTKCGAIKGACSDVKLGQLTGLFEKVKPAIDVVRKDLKVVKPDAADFIEKVAEMNVKVNMKKIIDQSSILKEMLEKKEIGLIGGMYNIETGEVTFFEDEAELSLANVSREKMASK